MNISSLIGIVCALAVFVISILTSTSTWGIFLDPHGILIVIGGTIAASLICFRLSIFVTLFRVFINKILGKDSQKYEIVIQEIVDLAKNNRDNASYLKENFQNIKTLFLKEAVEMTVQGGISPEAVRSEERRVGKECA